MLSLCVGVCPRFRRVGILPSVPSKEPPNLLSAMAFLYAASPLLPNVTDRDAKAIDARVREKGRMLPEASAIWRAG